MRFCCYLALKEKVIQVLGWAFGRVAAKIRRSVPMNISTHQHFDQMQIKLLEKYNTLRYSWVNLFL